MFNQWNYARMRQLHILLADPAKENGVIARFQQC